MMIRLGILEHTRLAAVRFSRKPSNESLRVEPLDSSRVSPAFVSQVQRSIHQLPQTIQTALAQFGIKVVVCRTPEEYLQRQNKHLSRLNFAFYLPSPGSKEIVIAETFQSRYFNPKTAQETPVTDYLKATGMSLDAVIFHEVGHAVDNLLGERLVSSGRLTKDQSRPAEMSRLPELNSLVQREWFQIPMQSDPQVQQVLESVFSSSAEIMAQVFGDLMGDSIVQYRMPKGFTGHPIKLFYPKTYTRIQDLLRQQGIL